MSLPQPWVERIFERLTVRYGRDFMARFEGVGSSPQDGAALVHADWARELDGYDRHPALLAWALDHLPDRPPTAGEFRRLAQSGPDIQPDQPRLRNFGAPASPEFIAAEIQRLQPALKRAPRDPRQWARDLIRDHEAGTHKCKPFRATLTTLEMARDAIKSPAFHEEQRP